MKLKTAILTAVFAGLAFAQPQPPLMRPADLDHLVAPIALYPDPLLAQIGGCHLLRSASRRAALGG